MTNSRKFIPGNSGREHVGVPDEHADLLPVAVNDVHRTVRAQQQGGGDHRRRLHVPEQLAYNGLSMASQWPRRPFGTRFSVLTHPCFDCCACSLPSLYLSLSLYISISLLPPTLRAHIPDVDGELVFLETRLGPSSLALYHPARAGGTAVCCALPYLRAMSGTWPSSEADCMSAAWHSGDVLR